MFVTAGDVEMIPSNFIQSDLGELMLLLVCVLCMMTIVVENIN